VLFFQVGTKYQTIHFNTTFPMSFLEPLLRMSLAADPDMRLLVQKILHTLIDRHHNLEKLLKPTYVNLKSVIICYLHCSNHYYGLTWSVCCYGMIAMHL
jgi:hypothetical protein